MWKVLQLTLQLLCFVVLGAAKDDHEEAQCFSPKLMAEVFPSLNVYMVLIFVAQSFYNYVRPP